MPPRTRTDRWPCPVARATDLISDSWTVLVLRDALFGTKRFEDFQRSLGAPRSVLTERLRRMVDDGLLERVQYQDRPIRHEYNLTDKGRAFSDVLVAMWKWGDEWAFRDGAPVVLIDSETGEEIEPAVVDSRTGEPIATETAVVRRRHRT